MLIILDRDGVINYDSDEYIKSPEEWRAIPGSIEKIAALSKAGHTIVVATNQSGVGRGYYTLKTLSDIHQKMLRLVNAAGGHIDHIYFCPHHPNDQCDCRKPKPGMIKKILKDYKTNGKESLLIGDSYRDLQAGKTAGCQLALVKTGNGLCTLKEIADFPGIDIYDDLQSVVI